MVQPHGGGGDPAIEVDLSGLDEFGGQVRGDVDEALAPGTDQVTGTYTSGVPFGATSWSSAVLAARSKYHERLQQSTDLMTAYVRLAEGMAVAAERIATAYRDADLNAMTRADQAYVDAVIKYETGVVAGAQQPPADRRNGAPPGVSYE